MLGFSILLVVSSCNVQLVCVDGAPGGTSLRYFTFTSLNFFLAKERVAVNNAKFSSMSKQGMQFLCKKKIPIFLMFWFLFRDFSRPRLPAILWAEKALGTRSRFCHAHPGKDIVTTVKLKPCGSVRSVNSDYITQVNS